MPQIVVNDPSFGESLSILAKGFGTSPEKRAEALALQARIDASEAQRRKIELENLEYVRQRKAQDETIKAIGGELQPDRFAHLVPSNLPAPSPDFIGPMPENPDRAFLPSRLAAARTIAANALSRGGTPEQALQAGFGSLGYGQVYAAGVPTDEAGARRVATLMGGKVPDANTPLTEAQRRVLATEKAAQEAAIEAQRQTGAMQREGAQQTGLTERQRIADEAARVREREKPVIAPQNSTVLMSPEQRGVLGVAPGDIPVQRSVGEKEKIILPSGQEIVGAGVDPNAPKPSYAGTGVEAQALNVIIEANRRHAAGEKLSPDDARAYALAYDQVYGEKAETRVIDGKTEIVNIRRAAPSNIINPNQLGQPSTLPVPAPTPVQPGPSVPAAVAGQPDVGQVTNQPAPNQGGTGQTRVVAPGVTVTRIGEGKPEGSPEHLKRSYVFQQTMQAGHKGQMEILKSGWRPTFTAEVLSAARPSDQNTGPAGAMWDAGISALANKALNQGDEPGARFLRHADSFLTAVLRDESGAAIARSEHARYFDTLIPRHGDSPRAIKDKMDRQAQMTRARQEGRNLAQVLAAGGLTLEPDVKIEQWDPNEPTPAGATPTPTQAAPPTQPTGAPPKPAQRRIRLNPQTGELEDVR